MIGPEGIYELNKQAHPSSIVKIGGLQNDVNQAYGLDSGRIYSFNPNWQEVFDFKEGEEIEVRNNNMDWQKAIFLRYSSFSKKIVRCVTCGHEDNYFLGKGFCTSNWPFFRKIESSKPIKIDWTDEAIIKKFRPYTYEEAEELLGRKVKTKDFPIKQIIMSVDDINVYVTNWVYTYEEFFKIFTFLDGSPCGKLKEGESIEA